LQGATLIEQAARRCAAIVQNLLTYTRKTEGEMRPLQLHEVVDSTLALLGNQLQTAGVELRVDQAPDLPALQGHFHDLCTVLTNLVINARDTALEAHRQDDRRPVVEVSTGLEGDAVVLRVRDNGAGLAEELHQRIFDPFYTTKEVGTGLGLSIVQGIVERHQATIDVESMPGEGTRFTLYLPLG
jgi:two-component system NtrC family sensor kinase